MSQVNPLTENSYTEDELNHLMIINIIEDKNKRGIIIPENEVSWLCEELKNKIINK